MVQKLQTKTVMDTIKGGSSLKKQRVLISVLIFVLLSFQIFSQTDNSKSGDQEELEKILEKCAEYCERLENSSLYFVCKETIIEEIRPRYGSLPGLEKNKYIYDYQLVRQRDAIDERRILLKENNRKKNIVDAQLKTKRFHHKYIVFGPIGLLGRKQQEIFEYKILKEISYKGEKAVILEALPKFPVEFSALYGKIWIRKRDFNILRIEWEQESLENFEEIEKIAKRLNAKPTIIFVSEYAFEKNEIRFPSKYSVEEIYILFRGFNYSRSKTTVIYDNYKFFTVDSKVNIRQKKTNGEENLCFKY